ncbi:retrovirus-related pol polyprotein from transposon TNT 1-94 [Tanacetum coccineum]|uniref:Retrovirus-related pol polyprotein from transposon TNT 1-94 n=1 Tax=Tanacetum coccineum TaxID=301880 RepID=A0ABQ4XAT5_9ASTR
MVVDPINPIVLILEPLSKITEGNKKQYIIDVKVMNYLLQVIPNDIYNSVDACKNAKEMWVRIKRLMHGSKITTHVRHSRLMDEFDKFLAKEGESFRLLQFEPHVLASRAKKATKNHDPLALIAHSNASSSHSHANSSYSTQPYYVTHPSSVVDYDDEYQGGYKDGRVDIQTKNVGCGGNANKNAGRNKTQGFNVGDESNQIIQRVPRTESTPGKANVQCYNCNEKGHYARECQKPKVRDAKYFKEQMLLAIKNEAGSNLNNEENDFMLDTSYGEDLEELTAAVMLMAQIQPANENAPSYYAKVVSQIHASSKSKKKAFKEREDHYLDDILDLEEKLSSHDQIVYKMGQSIQTIHMLGKKPNKVYDSFLKAGLGYTNPVRLKKAIAVQPKMYDGDLIHNNKLVIHSTDSEETFEDAKEKKQKHELLKVELEKSSSDSRDIQANLIKRIKIIENDFQRSQAQSIDFELEVQHQKEKMACDVSWKAKLSTLHDENVLLKHQVESTVKERENIKLEFQRLFNSVKATRVHHQNENNEMIENINQKTYDYADVHAQNQDLLMIISELKSKLRTIEKGKHVNNKFDKSETLGQLLCVTPFNKNLAIKVKNVSNTKVTSDRPNLVTS